MRRHLLALGLVLVFASVARAQQEAASNYPAVAAQQLVSGRVMLECIIGERGRLACEVLEEAPLYWDFGQAALAISTEWRVSQRTITGESAIGGRLRRTLVFEPGPPPHIRNVRSSRR
jgi:TonB family protein